MWWKQHKNEDLTEAPPPAPAEPAREPEGAPVALDPAAVEKRVIDELCEVYDPEIPVNIYELGLIYDVDVAADGNVVVEMTLTSPACPVAGSLPGEVEGRIRRLDGVSEVDVRLVWDPPWTPERMSEAARLELGLL